MRPVLALILLGFAGCGPGGGSPDDAIDVCEEAARHVESCTGVYVTPPLCEEGAATQAEGVLGQDCSAIAASAGGSEGKADGALCNWFGRGCSPDEPIFDGPACASAADCAEGSSCQEGHCFAGLGSPEATAMLDALTHTAARGGNAVTPLITAKEAREEWLRLIGGATRSIHVVTLLIEDNTTGHAVVDALIAAAARGVEIRVIVDSLSEYAAGDFDLVEKLAEGGVEVIAFNPVVEWSILRQVLDLGGNQRIHEKILVVDGEIAIAGGRNLGDHYLGDGKWRDRDVVVSGPAVVDLQHAFLTDWDEFSAWERAALCPLRRFGVFCRADASPDLRGDPAYYPAAAPAGDETVRVVYSNPRRQPKPDGYVTTLALIRSARRSIKITNAYFVPPARLRRHLRAAAARGVDVQVVTNSQTSNDQRSMWWSAINHYEELIKGGVVICEWRGEQTVHAKAMIVDDQVAVVESYNLDPRSAMTNSELLVLIEGSAVGPLARAFDEDRSFCDVAGYRFSWQDRMMAAAHRLAEPLF